MWFEAVTGGVYKKATLKTFRNIHKKTPCWSLFLIKLPDFKKRLQCRCFPVNIAKFLKSFLRKHLRLIASVTAYSNSTQIASLVSF